MKARAVQAIDFRGSEKFGKEKEAAYELLQRHVPVLKEDRVLNKHIETLRTVVHSEGFVKAVESLVGRLL